MKKFLRWSAIVIGCLVVVGFLAFLYFIPPLTMVPQTAFTQPLAQALDAPLKSIKDPAEKILAERGKMIVGHSACSDCHTPQGAQGPNYNEFLAGGGMKDEFKLYGSVVSRNLTPDKETGIGMRTDAEIMRVLRSGVSHDGRVMTPVYMPWFDFSNMTDEDRYAVVVYLRHLKPVWNKIPGYSPLSDFEKLSETAGDYAEHKSLH